MATLFFFYFAGIIVLTSVLVVALRNPIHSALSLLIMFFHVAGLYVTLRAEFLAAVQVIVYAGAILVLYLFVVMLLNIKREDRYHPQFLLGALLGLTLLTEGILMMVRGTVPEQPASASAATGATQAGSSVLPFVGNTETIGEVLFSTYLYPFEIASLILLVAMIGAIVLAKKDIGLREP